MENGSVTWTGSTKPEVVEAAGTGSGSAASGSGGATAWIANSPTKIEWSKIDRETGQILGGSSWNLQQQVNGEWKTLNVVTDCSQAPCKAEPEDVQYYDADPKPGAFRVERLPVGTYGIVEQPMEGYHPQGAPLHLYRGRHTEHWRRGAGERGQASLGQCHRQLAVVLLDAAMRRRGR
ncbi:hypothetical protein [Bifidobacterium pseudolongum]|uniref:hypothetical protein n=1 Tax=Bifidobacterium pseudolongum TaxID=1694 RepID=UPI0011788FB9|nr:hypothetical protein [Bifidobacterium pseudolongum]